MKIAIVSVTQGEGHGAESVLVELMRGWVASQTTDELLIIAPVHSRVLRLAEHLALPSIPFSARRDALTENLRGLYRVRKQFQHVDILHAWTARGFEFAGGFGRSNQSRISGTLHDHPKAFFHGSFRQWMIRYHANHMHGLVCVSQAVKAACEESGFRSPMQVIHNGLMDLPPATTPSSRVRIGFLGMKARFKGFDLIRPWMEATVAAGAQWHLYGEADPDLVQQLQGLPTDAYVLHGRKASEEIYPDCDIIVHASDAFDSLPTVLIEAARAGLPALASSLGGGPEIVRHGETGFVFSPVDPGEGLTHLLDLIADPALRNQMGQKARLHYSSDFGVDPMVTNYSAFWRSLV
ncbi:MAG: glycosyltransferase involved in cell wall biosynthesis [Candidatus Omnitrophota bacterium]